VGSYVSYKDAELNFKQIVNVSITIIVNVSITIIDDDG